MIYFEILIQWFPVSSLLCSCRRYILAKSWFFSPKQQRKLEDLRLYVLCSPNWLAYWLNVTLAVSCFLFLTNKGIQTSLSIWLFTRVYCSFKLQQMVLPFLIYWSNPLHQCIFLFLFYYRSIANYQGFVW